MAKRPLSFLHFVFFRLVEGLQKRILSAARQSHNLVHYGAKVRLYEVKGGKHSWQLAHLDTCEEILKFFEQYLILK